MIRHAPWLLKLLMLFSLLSLGTLSYDRTLTRGLSKPSDMDKYVMEVAGCQGPGNRATIYHVTRRRATLGYSGVIHHDK